jgi:hypothetical protein
VTANTDELVKPRRTVIGFRIVATILIPCKPRRSAGFSLLLISESANLINQSANHLGDKGSSQEMDWEGMLQLPHPKCS